jgi:carbonic anhydrase
MVVQHTECGMLTFTDEELKAQLQADTGLEPPFPLGTFTDLDENVRRTIFRLEANPFLAHTHAVRGFVYDVRTGKLQEIVP